MFTTLKKYNKHVVFRPPTGFSPAPLHKKNTDVLAKPIFYSMLLHKKFSFQFHGILRKIILKSTFNLAKFHSEKKPALIRLRIYKKTWLKP